MSIICVIAIVTITITVSVAIIIIVTHGRFAPLKVRISFHESLFMLTCKIGVFAFLFLIQLRPPVT